LSDKAARPRGAVCNGKLFIVCIFDQSRVIALDCATGERRWSCSVGGWPGSGATLAKDRVLVPSQDKHVYCLNRDTGAIVWKYRAPNWLGSDVAVQGDTVYVSNHTGKLIQLSLETGRELRRFETTDTADLNALAGGAPLVVNQTAYFCSSKGQIYAVDIATSQLKWKLRPTPGGGIYSDPAHEAKSPFRMFITCRTDGDLGEDAIIAIGKQ
jgi:outer membrane protein assembly factor BamB